VGLKYRIRPLIWLVAGLALGLALGLVFVLGVDFSADQSSAARPGYAIRGDSQFRLAAGLGSGLAGGAARRYVVFLVWAGGTVPFRLARFLEWACTAGLMRYSGPAYQFRHRELQLWLAAHPDPMA
jgi:hypothetical protein